MGAQAGPAFRKHETGHVLAQGDPDLRSVKARWGSLPTEIPSSSREEPPYGCALLPTYCLCQMSWVSAS